MQSDNQSPTMTADEIADILGMKRATFLRKRLDLINRHDFPPPLPLVASPVWSRAQVMAWVNRSGIPDDQPIAAPGSAPTAVVEAARAALLSRMEARP